MRAGYSQQLCDSEVGKSATKRVNRDRMKVCYQKSRILEKSEQLRKDNVQNTGDEQFERYNIMRMS